MATNFQFQSASRLDQLLMESEDLRRLRSLREVIHSLQRLVRPFTIIHVEPSQHRKHETKPPRPIPTIPIPIVPR